MQQKTPFILLNSLKILLFKNTLKKPRRHSLCSRLKHELHLAHFSTALIHRLAIFIETRSVDSFSSKSSSFPCLYFKQSCEKLYLQFASYSSIGDASLKRSSVILLPTLIPNSTYSFLWERRTPEKFHIHTENKSNIAAAKVQH